MKNNNGNDTIMIVEDEVLIGMLLKMELGNKGFSVIGPIATGERAVEQYEIHKPGLILMDIQLAGKMNGIETAETIMQKNRPGIIFVTAYMTNEYINAARKLNLFDFIEKPVNTHELLNLINKHGLN